MGAEYALDRGTMKWTGALMMAAMAGTGFAHEGHEEAPGGEVLTIAVATGAGSHIYENVPWYFQSPRTRDLTA